MTKKIHTIKFRDEKVYVQNGELLLFSLMNNDIYYQGKAHDRKRGAFCGMGVCQECLVELENGETTLACQTLVEGDLEIKDDE